MKNIRSAIIKLFLFVADTWGLHRRLIQPTFHMNILETFIGTFVDASNLLVKRLKDQPNELNITHMVNQCVIDILNGEFSTRTDQCIVEKSSNFNIKLFLPSQRLCSVYRCWRKTASIWKIHHSDSKYDYDFGFRFEWFKHHLLIPTEEKWRCLIA